MARLAWLLSLSLLSCPLVLAQESNPAAPKTKLERFVVQDGAVIIKGFAAIGTLRGKYGGAITVESKEFFNIALSKKEYGITIEVKETARIERESTSYIDYDEIDSLIKGIDYISKVTKTSTRLDQFQADYRTRGDLVLSTFSTDAGIQAAVSSGTIGKTDVFIELTDLTKLRDLIVSAKSRLDSIKS
jgi:hypothetical protein